MIYLVLGKLGYSISALEFKQHDNMSHYENRIESTCQLIFHCVFLIRRIEFVIFFCFNARKIITTYVTRGHTLLVHVNS